MLEVDDPFPAALGAKASNGNNSVTLGEDVADHREGKVRRWTDGGS